MDNKNSNEVYWRVHTVNLLREVYENNPNMGIFEKPFNIFGRLLAAVGKRASELGDEELDALMIRLTIYSVADPQSPDYDKDVVHRYLRVPIDV